MAKSRLKQLLRQVIDGRGSMRFRDFEALLEALGFKLVRRKGSHRIYLHPKAGRPFPVQPEGSEAKWYQRRELRDMIQKHDLTLDPGA